MKIIINNSKSQIVTKPKNLIKLREASCFKIRVKGAFYSQAYRDRIWDGFKRYISETGQIDTGLVPRLLRHIHDTYGEHDLEIVDNRNRLLTPKVVKEFGNYKFRDYQVDTLEKIVNYQLAPGIPFPRGVIDGATNFGKTFISVGVYLAYRQPTCLVLGNTELFNQLMDDISKMLPGHVGYISSKGVNWNNFMIVMVKTCSNLIKRDIKAKQRLQSYSVCLVDEGDLATSKTYSSVLSNMHNSFVKLALTGSAFLSKDRNKNQALRGEFGDTIVRIKNHELIKMGHSSKIKVFINSGNTDIIPDHLSYPEVESDYLINNESRNRRILSDTFHLVITRKIFPVLIFCNYHEHIEVLMGLIPKIFGTTRVNIRYDWVHGKRTLAERKQIVSEFKAGKIHILIGSKILRRALNLPLTKAIQYAAGGYDEAGIRQGPIGRATRSHKSKKGTIILDYYDKGRYLEKHSRRRVIYYKNEKFQVTKNYAKR